MKKQSNLKICVLGGRNFGKTSLLSSLVLISGGKSSGITVSGGNEQKLSIYNEYKNNKGKLIATDWDDICKFRYNLTGNENKKYKLTFIDYPGEFFQKFFSDSGVFSARFLSMFGLQKKNQESIDASRTFTKNEAKSAKRLVNELKNADAFIVLLPADVTKDIYKVNLQIFKTQLQVLLEKIHNINPYIPVCLAINKWDMFGKAYTELSDILQSKPYKDFDNMLNLECGKYYFCQAISAFGKNRSAEAKTKKEQEEFKEEWDRKSEPVNVMQMLLKISEVAENSRYLHLREKYNNASCFSKIFHFPAMLASLCRKGANAEEDRNFCTRKLTRCTLGLIGTVASVVLLCFVAIGALTTLGEFTYLKIQESSIAEVEKSLGASKTDNTTAEKIKGLKETLAGHPLKLAFFCKPQVENLSARITEIEQQYNLRVWQNAVAFCDNDRNKDEDPIKLQSEERKARCETRIKHLERELAKLTDLPTRNSDGRTLKDCFQQKINQEKTLLANIGKDGGLDDALYALKVKKIEERCSYIESLIDRYESTYSYRKKDFDELRRQLKNLEQQYCDQLIADLNEIKDIVSKNYAYRIALAKKRIARIEQEKTHLSIRSPWHERNKQLIDAEKLNIENWKYDSKFYAAFDAAMKPGDNQIQRLVDFLNTYPKESYSRCVADWDVAEKKKNELICAVNNNLQKILSENSVTETKITAEEKVKRLQNCIKAYEQARKENPTEIEKYDVEIATLKRNLTTAEKDTKFEAEYNKILTSADNGKLMRINSFITAGEFAQVNFPHKVAEYAKLEKEKARLLNKWNKEQEEARKKYPDDAKQSRAIRLACAEKLLTEYNRILVEYLPASTEYNSLNRCIRDLKGQIAEHKKYNALFYEFNKVKTLTDSFRVVNAIAAFDIDFKAGDYPAKDGMAIFAELNSLRRQHNEVVTRKFYEAEKKFKKPADNEFAKLVEYYQKLKQNVDAFMQKISEDVSFYKDLQNHKSVYEASIKKYQLYANILAEIKPLIADDGQMSIKVARERLSAIKAFYENEHFCKTLNSAPELVNLLTQIKTVQTGVENFIGCELSSKLEDIAKELAQDALPEDQINNWNRQLNVIDDYCSTMIQSNDNSVYRNFSKKRKDLHNRLGRTKLKTRFERERAALDQKLENLNVAEKINNLNNFINTYKAYDDFKETLAYYESMRDDNIQKQKFNSLEQKCTGEIDRKPSKAAPIFELTTYRGKINEFLVELKEFENVSVVQQKVDDLKVRLNGEIAYVKKTIGDGSYHDIEEKEKAYKNNPTRSTYASLQHAIKSFDSKEYSSYEDKVEDIKRKSQEDYRLARNLQDAISEYRNYPNHNSFNQFHTALQTLNTWISGIPNQSGYGSQHNLSEYSSYIQKINSGFDIEVTCINASFEADWKKLTYNISCNNSIISGEYHCTGIFSGNNNGNISLPRNGSLKCELKFENIAAYKTKQTFISFWQIVQTGNGKQSFKVVVDEKMWMKNTRFYNATFNVRISGVPELPREFEL